MLLFSAFPAERCLQCVALLYPHWEGDIRFHLLRSVADFYKSQ